MMRTGRFSDADVDKSKDDANNMLVNQWHGKQLPVLLVPLACEGQ